MPEELCCTLASPEMLALAAYDLDEFAETAAGAGVAGLDVETAAAVEEAVAELVDALLAGTVAVEDVVLHQHLAGCQHPIVSVPLEALKETHLDR